MNRAFPIALLAVSTLTLPVGAVTAKPAPTVTYSGNATSIDGTVDYGTASFTIKNRKLVTWNANAVPRQCEFLEKMNFGFTVASNVLKAYGLKSKDVKLSKKGRLKFTYTQPSHLDKIVVNVKFGAKRASGTIVNTAGPGELGTQNCSASAKISLKK